MPTIFKKLKISAVGLTDLIAAGFVKSAEERLLSPVIGNATFMSGGLKAAVAMMVNGRGRFRKIAAMALGIDAGEDFAAAILNMLGGGGLGGGRQGGQGGDF